MERIELIPNEPGADPLVPGDAGCVETDRALAFDEFGVLISGAPAVSVGW